MELRAPATGAGRGKAGPAASQKNGKERLMNRLAPLVCLPVALGCATAAPAHAQAPTPAPLTPAQIAARARNAVVLLRTAGGLGSGFILDKTGRIATNLHVLDSGAGLTVVLADGRESSDVEVLATDESHDLAVLRLRGGGAALTSLRLADSDRVQPGDHVVAIGHPLGLANTVSDGLVSAIRQVASQLTVLQISAPISPGSSGGPLLDDHGEVVGISTLVATEGQNLNFAIPSNALKPLLTADKGTPIARWRPSSSGGSGSASATRAAPARHVPHHELGLLHGCPAERQRDIATRLEEAIHEGAPVYNEGFHQACYRIYESVAREIDRKVPGCAGPRRALLDGVARADALSGYTAKAWAMRDAFDGLLDLLDRAAHR
jgi:serine protease Do